MNLQIPLLRLDIPDVNTLDELQNFSKTIIQDKLKKDGRLVPVLFGKSSSQQIIIADLKAPASVKEAPRAIYEAGARAISVCKISMCVLVVDVAVCDIPLSHPDFENIRRGSVKEHPGFKIARRTMFIAQRPGYHRLTFFKSVLGEGLKITALGEEVPVPEDDLGDWFLLYKDVKVN